MIVLGIVSAVRNMEVAILEDGVLLAEHCVSEEIRTEDLISHINLSLEQAKKDIKDVSVIAVAVGPGSYGGLRGALASAKGLSQVLGAKVVAIPTLLAIAQNFSGTNGLIVVASPAMKDEYNVAFFGSSNGSARRVTEDMLCQGGHLALVLSKMLSEAYLASPKREIFSRLKALNGGTKVIEGDQSLASPHARVAAELGRAMFLKGEISDPFSLRPVYSHDPNIREYKGA